jgi:hypothetical protein
MEQKKTLGQYFTTNQQYILSGMKIPDNVVNIIEPFAGEEHLLDFITDRNRYNIECFDIDPKKEHIIRQDTINDPPSYTDKFIITNPPYLARNKTECKVAFDNYDTNDLFKCFLKNLNKSLSWWYCCCPIKLLVVHQKKRCFFEKIVFRTIQNRTT